MIKEKIQKKKIKNEKKKIEENKKKNVIDNINNFYSGRINELKERIKSEKNINSVIRYEQKKNSSRLEKEQKEEKKAQLSKIFNSLTK